MLIKAEPIIESVESIIKAIEIGDKEYKLYSNIYIYIHSFNAFYL